MKKVVAIYKDENSSTPYYLRRDQPRALERIKAKQNQAG
jgi:hypothetical protein